MMKHEFERLAGYEVSQADYTKIIEPMYMVTNLSKHDFVKCLDRKRFEVKAEKPVTLLRMRVTNEHGYNQTPNHCWWFIKYVDHIDTDITSGKLVVRLLDADELDKLRAHGLDTDYSTGYEVDETDVIIKK